MSAVHNPIADYRSYPRVADLLEFARHPDLLELRWSDDRLSPFHHQWLRDNCPCAECVYSVTREQLLEIVDVAADIAPLAVAIATDGYLDIDWQGGHRSRYHPGWLRAHAYDDDSRAERLAQQRSRRLWQAEMNQQLPVFDYPTLMHDDQALLQWLLALRDLGISQVTGMPTAVNSLQGIARRIAFIRESNFGVLFNVQSKADADSNAYTAFNLPLHTDLPTRELQPGLQFLHCLVNDARGGASVFVDGFAVAEALRREAPEDFRSLCELPIEFRNKDRRSDYRCLAPLIALDALGNVSEIRIANFLRGPFDAP
ncbi:MAG: gamma-butyrobetaine dioxygenase, partial [Pseudomonadales bacterium RIFCSPLOWO2_02_FULL_63_210]